MEFNRRGFLALLPGIVGVLAVPVALPEVVSPLAPIDAAIKLKIMPGIDDNYFKQGPLMTYLKKKDSYRFRA